MNNYIAIDTHGNHINAGSLFDCRIAAAQWSHINDSDAAVYEAASDEDEEDSAEPEAIITLHAGDVSAALAEARDWLLTDNGDDERLTEDLEVALHKFDEAVDRNDLVDAYQACHAIALEWASGDRSGFMSLSDIARR